MPPLMERKLSLLHRAAAVLMVSRAIVAFPARAWPCGHHERSGRGVAAVAAYGDEGGATIGGDEEDAVAGITAD